MSQQTILVNTKLLKWVTNRMGWTLNELAKEANIPIESIKDSQIEKCEIKVTRLEKIAKDLKHPITAFFLPEPPVEQEIPDFRKVPGAPQELSREVCLSIRQARVWQAVSKKLLSAQSQSLKPEIENYSISDDPEDVAGVERSRLGFESETRLASKKARKSPRDFYNELRNSVEACNIFVYQQPIEVGDTRGFTLPTGPPYAIVISSSDSYHARIFTLLHEYAHILLKKAGICLPNLQAESPDSDGHKTETWCNDFAGSALMPKREFLELVEQYTNSGKSNNEITNKLSSRFKVSKQAVMVRTMRIKKDIPFLDFCKSHFNSIHDMPSKKSSGGGPSQAILCQSRRGRKFIHLVLDATEKKLITRADELNYLRLNPKYLGELERSL